MRRTVALPLCVLVLCAFAMAGAACATSATPPSTGNVHRKTPIVSFGANRVVTAPFPTPAPGVDLHSPTAVAIAEVEATWTLNTTLAAGWYAGELAASAYMTPSYAASMRDYPPLGAPGATWMVWAAHRATTSVTASVEADPGGPSDTALTAYRKVIATVTPRSTAGWVGQPEVWLTYLVLSRTFLGAPWRVALSETTQ
jgi:hypothetical protein